MSYCIYVYYYIKFIFIYTYLKSHYIKYIHVEILSLYSYFRKSLSKFITCMFYNTVFIITKATFKPSILVFNRTI